MPLIICTLILSILTNIFFVLIFTLNQTEFIHIISVLTFILFLISFTSILSSIFLLLASEKNTLFKNLFSFFLADWILKKFENGGLAVLLRTFWTSLILYLLTLIVYYFVNTDEDFINHQSKIQYAIFNTLPWLGAMLTVVYASLYSRFSSQWNYLANLYNQIKTVQCQNTFKSNQEKESFYSWQAGFIEDAYTLHLYKKPMFISCIAHMLDPNNDKEKYTKIMNNLEKYSFTKDQMIELKESINDYKKHITEKLL